MELRVALLERIAHDDRVGRNQLAGAPARAHEVVQEDLGGVAAVDNDGQVLGRAPSAPCRPMRRGKNVL